MKRYRALCLWDPTLDKQQLLGRLPQVADVDWAEPDRSYLMQHIGEYDAYMASLHVRLDRELIERGTRLKIVATPTTGLDHLDLDVLAEKNILLLDNKTEFELLNRVTATAEMAWGLMLAAVRKIPHAYAAAMQGDWARDRFRGHQISGKTLGVLGVGRLGKMVVAYGNAFRLRVLGCDRKPIDLPGVQMVDFDTLLRESDIVSIHIHLTPDNRKLIGAREFAKMKRGVVIVNTSRGGIIDEDAFLAALQSGQVGAAGLDVIEGEWRNDLVDHPLIRFAREHDNVVIVPHLGGITTESQTMTFQFMANKLAAALEKLDTKG